MEQVAGLSDKALAAMHGMGPKAIRILRDAVDASRTDGSARHE